jgi:hypothetical protein
VRLISEPAVQVAGDLAEVVRGASKRIDLTGDARLLAPEAGWVAALHLGAAFAFFEAFLAGAHGCSSRLR